VPLRQRMSDGGQLMGGTLTIRHDRSWLNKYCFGVESSAVDGSGRARCWVLRARMCSLDAGPMPVLGGWLVVA